MKLLHPFGVQWLIGHWSRLFADGLGIELADNVGSRNPWKFPCDGSMIDVMWKSRDLLIVQKHLRSKSKAYQCHGIPLKFRRREKEGQSNQRL
ncbi:hypothetical protein BDV37DRAFT_248487, partial [Aspergillus pseudonomiae]